MLLSAVFLFSTALIVVAVWLSMSNISAGKELEARQKKIDELIRQQAACEERIQQMKHEQQQLFSMVSHDVKGPFNRIFALIQLLQFSSDNLLPEQKEYVGKIHIMVADGLGMIRNLADTQMLEADAVTFHEDAFNLSSVVSSLVRNYKTIAEKKKIPLQAGMPSSLMAFTDQYMITRILDNVLSNAIKFTAEGKQIFVDVQEESDRIKINVRDEGPGISEEDQHKLYKKFQTLTAQPAGGETATGIGLSVAKAFANKAGIELSCSSRLGEGTTFSIRVKKAKTI